MFCSHQRRCDQRINQNIYLFGAMSRLKHENCCPASNHRRATQHGTSTS